jgi:DNA-binding XRE family transcriptional regulator
MVTGLGSAILDALERLQKTQFWLAEEVGVSPQAVTKWIQTGKINRENAIEVARVLRISVDALVGGSQSANEQIGQAIEALPDEQQQQVLDFIQYKIERSETFMTQERAAHYLKMIDAIRSDMARRAGGNDTQPPANPESKKK